MCCSPRLVARVRLRPVRITETTIRRIGSAANDAEDLKLATVPGQDFGNKLRSVEQQLRHLTGTRARHQPGWGKHH